MNHETHNKTVMEPWVVRTILLFKHTQTSSNTLNTVALENEIKIHSMCYPSYDPF